MKRKNSIAAERRKEIKRRLESASESGIARLLKRYGSSFDGLKNRKIEKKRDEYGSNIISRQKRKTLPRRIFDSFADPFTIILLFLAVVSLITDIILPASSDKNPATVIIICVMVLIAGTLRFVQESRSDRSAEKLTKMVQTTATVIRDGKAGELPLEEIVVGDMIKLAAGDIIPADLRLLRSKDLFVSQSSLTGESNPIEKTSVLKTKRRKNRVLSERENLLFMGSTIISGSGLALAIVTGQDTLLGQVAQTLTAKPAKTSFDKGVDSVSLLLVRFMSLMVPVVFLINGFTKGDWLSALLFAISIAVGLTPEMLPMIVTACLAKGAITMSKKKTVVKNLNSIQSFGAMDILCTDKTGTLTEDKIVLERHLNVHGIEDERVLRHAYLNSYFQTGYKNLMDLAIISKNEEEENRNRQLEDLSEKYVKVDEIPFDFARRRMSVVVKDRQGKTQLITKGAVEEILSICSYVALDGKTLPLTEQIKNEVLADIRRLGEEGMRVIAIAQKNNPEPVGDFSVQDESEMVLLGYLAFLDPIKPSASAAISALLSYGVDVKILTGDSDIVTAAVCRKVGLDVRNILLGNEIDALTDQELAERAENTNVFAKLSPNQKARIITVLKKAGHVVGYMGDGINDAPSIKCSDVGISVDTAVDIAKESADIILLEKDLSVLREGIVEGRRIYANMIKYIKMTASSNFGNMLSVVLASAFLPFLPMMPVQILLLNLIYDISCIAIPWDNVDKSFISAPKKWNAADLKRFMLFFGPVSSAFDILTYALMFFVIAPLIAQGSYFSGLIDQTLFMKAFQTGWFIESMWSQTIIIHMIRTERIPFIQSHASLSLILLTLSGIAFATLITFTPIGADLGFVSLPPVYFGYLALIVILYMLAAGFAKKIYIRHFKELL